MMNINQVLEPWNIINSISYNPVFFDKEIEETELPNYNLEYISTKPKETIQEKPKETPKQTTIGDIFGFNGWNLENIPAPKKPLESKTETTSFKSNWANQLSLVYRSMGLPENAIKNLISKNALESSWGKSTQGRYNYGNITTGKYWKGDYVNGKDHNALGKSIRLKFRSYKDMKEYAKDELQFLTRLYDFNPNDTFDTFINKLLGQNSGNRHYAEDKKYADKVKKVYNNLS